jgi:hypothetical protein
MPNETNDRFRAVKSKPRRAIFARLFLWLYQKHLVEVVDQEEKLVIGWP